MVSSGSSKNSNFSSLSVFCSRKESPRESQNDEGSKALRKFLETILSRRQAYHARLAPTKLVTPALLPKRRHFLGQSSVDHGRFGRKRTTFDITARLQLPTGRPRCGGTGPCVGSLRYFHALAVLLITSINVNGPKIQVSFLVMLERV
jgi:hypothetical protein